MSRHGRIKMEIKVNYRNVKPDKEKVATTRTAPTAIDLELEYHELSELCVWLSKILI